MVYVIGIEILWTVASFVRAVNKLVSKKIIGTKRINRSAAWQPQQNEWSLQGNWEGVYSLPLFLPVTLDIPDKSQMQWRERARCPEQLPSSTSGRHICQHPSSRSGHQKLVYLRAIDPTRRPLLYRLHELWRTSHTISLQGNRFTCSVSVIMGLY